MGIDLVRNRSTLDDRSLEVKRLGCHTAVLAQSGSGKSFMVGRLVEELALKSKNRIIIFDPNSDFVRLTDPEPGVWSASHLKPWFFPGESHDQFSRDWAKVSVTVLSNRNLASAKPLRINWGGLSDAERASIMNIDPRDQPDLYWCLFLSAELALERWDDSSEEDYDFAHFQNVADDVCEYLLTGKGPKDVKGNPLAGRLRSSVGPALAFRFRALVYALAEYQIWRSYGDQDLDLTEFVTSPASGPTVVVVDLLSLDTEEERIAVTTRIMRSLWNAARDGYGDVIRDVGEPDQRVPTLIVIDEAHNLVPATRASPGAERLAAEVIRVAAEGRKFGLYLLVVTQRPRKVDSNILSECDNLLMMKMTNSEDINYAKGIFGFLSGGVATTASTLGVGDVLLQGRVDGGDEVWHVAPRRTREGGKGLDDKYWGTPYP